MSIEVRRIADGAVIPVATPSAANDLVANGVAVPVAPKVRTHNRPKRAEEAPAESAE
ncbi:hypothetical protein HUO13_12075 [Saccharopolyspora erythraea]|uniref:hypothetical protein n=1 Tax=Saccharopolyspora erythraea TaxID=1836 RepID=UPI001BA94B89|nr:hypothetical protein [Saccharopolyspora erythraea]QUH01450.1 hypothetical protein HUO13_12075 [Saccharopolyspora erythraea]